MDDPPSISYFTDRLDMITDIINEEAYFSKRCVAPT